MIEHYTAPTPNGHKIRRCKERPGSKAGLDVPIRLNPADTDPEEVKKATQNIIQK